MKRVSVIVMYVYLLFDIVPPRAVPNDPDLLASRHKYIQLTGLVIYTTSLLAPRALFCAIQI